LCGHWFSLLGVAELGNVLRRLVFSATG
jgi:hypothetical protein